MIPKIGLLILFAFLSSTTWAQFVVGAKWTYSEWNGNSMKPISVEINKDTLINTVTWNILEGIGGCAGSFEHSAIRKDSAKIFVLDLDTNIESLLYDFDLVAGDSYEVNIPGAGFAYLVNIDSIGIMTIDGVDHKVQFIDNIEFGSYIVENIGSNNFLVPQGNICSPHYFGLRCFSFANTFFDFDPDHECDETIVVSSIAQMDEEKNILVYPNPTTDFVVIDNVLKTPIAVVNLLDFQGRRIAAFEYADAKNEIELNLGQLAFGIYFLSIETRDGVVVKKLVVQ